jgi:predicted nucleotide-binding protein (sugar kinase/HSP70/actin superfamily)
MKEQTMESTANGVSTKKKLKVMDGFDADAELAAFEETERARLGLDTHTNQWIEDMVGLGFTTSQKSDVTLLIGGLTIAQDYLVEGAFRGIGYNVQVMDSPDNLAFQHGKEFGNRGQCNPTYFTVGNLIKYLCTLRDKHGLSAKEVVDRYVFLTAGACGPCRFGMYVTEYRKALRDAGFDGFRVMFFQQKTGDMKQATGEATGLQLNATFFWALAKGVFVGDVLNALAYRIRPYEVEAGATDRAIEASKKILHEALEKRTMILPAIWKCKPLFEAIKVDRTQVKPKVSIIGEFWAMTTEGDGNYQLQRFLESEGAEDDVQLVTAWILYSIWEGRFDTGEREDLRGADVSYYGLGNLGPFGIAQKKIGLWAGDKALRALFHTFAYSLGLYGYHLPDMDKIAAVSHSHYNNDLRGGEGHMEVGKLILNVVGKKAHMTLSVKPFGCMPSAGVSDGVQSMITEKFPGTIYCPVETSGDGRVNFYSRVQMYLFKAKQAAILEYDQVLKQNGITDEQLKAFLQTSPKFSSPLHKSPHAHSGTAADLVQEVAPYITMTRAERWKKRLTSFASTTKTAAKNSPHMVVELFGTAVRETPVVVQKVKEDIAIYRQASKANKARKAKGAQATREVSAAAE